MKKADLELLLKITLGNQIDTLKYQIKKDKLSIKYNERSLKALIEAEEKIERLLTGHDCTNDSIINKIHETLFQANKI